jgi:hypothetical protein
MSFKFVHRCTQLSSVHNSAVARTRHWLTSHLRPSHFRSLFRICLANPYRNDKPGERVRRCGHDKTVGHRGGCPGVRPALPPQASCVSLRRRWRLGLRVTGSIGESRMHGAIHTSNVRENRQGMRWHGNSSVTGLLSRAAPRGGSGLLVSDVRQGNSSEPIVMCTVSSVGLLHFGLSVHTSQLKATSTGNAERKVLHRLS